LTWDKKMVKLPRKLSGLKIIKGLIRNGYVIKGKRGSHATLSNGKIHITVVMKKEVSIGVLKQVLRITGLSIKEFL